MNRQESSSSSSHNVEEEAASSMDGIQWDDGSVSLFPLACVCMCVLPRIWDIHANPAVSIFAGRRRRPRSDILGRRCCDCHRRRLFQRGPRCWQSCPAGLLCEWLWIVAECWWRQRSASAAGIAPTWRCEYRSSRSRRCVRYRLVWME